MFFCAIFYAISLFRPHQLLPHRNRERVMQLLISSQSNYENLKHLFLISWPFLHFYQGIIHIPFLLRNAYIPKCLKLFASIKFQLVIQPKTQRAPNRKRPSQLPT